MIPIKEVKLVLDEPENWLPKKVDGVIVFGHTDNRVPGHAAKIFRSAKARKIVVTGGSGQRNKSLNGFRSEADFFVSVLKKNGVPEEAMIVERNSTNTLENVQFGIEACRKVGFFPESLIVVALPPHLRRVRATFAKQFPYIKIFGSTFQIGDEEWLDASRMKRIIEEIDRLKEYAVKGDIALASIPHDVNAAYEIISSFLKELAR